MRSFEGHMCTDMCTGVDEIDGYLVDSCKSRFPVQFWFGLVLWHINHCRLFNAKSIFIRINSSISNISVWYQYSLFCLHTVKYKNSSVSNNSV